MNLDTLLFARFIVSSVKKFVIIGGVMDAIEETELIYYLLLSSSDEAADEFNALSTLEGS